MTRTVTGSAGRAARSACRYSAAHPGLANHRTASFVRLLLAEWMGGPVSRDAANTGFFGTAAVAHLAGAVAGAVAAYFVRGADTRPRAVSINLTRLPWSNPFCAVALGTGDAVAVFATKVGPLDTELVSISQGAGPRRGAGAAVAVAGVARHTGVALWCTNMVPTDRPGDGRRGVVIRTFLGYTFVAL